MSKSKGKLKPADEKAIQTNYELLKGQVDGGDIVAHLYQNGVLDLNDLQEVKNAPRADKRMELILNWILRAGPGHAYNIFIESLEKDYSFVAEKLKECASATVEGPASVYAWFVDIPQSVKCRMLTDTDAARLASCFYAHFEILFLGLGLSKADIELEKMNTPNNPILMVCHLLIQWKQINGKKASIETLVNRLIEMETEGNSAVDWSVLEIKVKAM